METMYHKNPHTGVVKKCVYGDDCPLDPKHRGDYHFDNIQTAYEFDHKRIKADTRLRDNMQKSLLAYTVVPILCALAGVMFNNHTILAISIVCACLVLVGILCCGLCYLVDRNMTKLDYGNVDKKKKSHYVRVNKIPQRLPEDADVDVKRAEYLEYIIRNTGFDSNLLRLSTDSLRRISALNLNHPFDNVREKEKLKFNSIKSDIPILLKASDRETLIHDLKEIDTRLDELLSESKIYEKTKSIQFPHTNMDEYYSYASIHYLAVMLTDKKKYLDRYEKTGFHNTERFENPALIIRECFDDTRFPIALAEKDYENDTGGVLTGDNKKKVESIAAGTKVSEKNVYEVPECLIPEIYKVRVKALLSKQSGASTSSYRAEQVPVYLVDTLRAFAELPEDQKNDPSIILEFEASIVALEKLVNETRVLQAEEKRNALIANRIFLEEICGTADKIDL